MKHSFVIKILLEISFPLMQKIRIDKYETILFKFSR